MERNSLTKTVSKERIVASTLVAYAGGLLSAWALLAFGYGQVPVSVRVLWLFVLTVPLCVLVIAPSRSIVRFAVSAYVISNLLIPIYLLLGAIGAWGLLPYLQVALLLCLIVSGVIVVWTSLRNFSKSTSGGVALGVLLGVAYGGLVIWGVEFGNFRPDGPDLWNQQLQLAYQSVPCAWHYKHLHGTFPADLDDLQTCNGLGSASKGSNRLIIAFKSSRDHFVVTVSGRSLWKQTPGVTADDSGILRVDNRYIVDPGDGPKSILLLSSCVSAFQRGISDHAYPVSLEMLSQPEGRCPSIRQHLISSNEAEFSGYRFSYSTSTNNSDGEGFRIIGRPDRYGKSGLRSYYTDESGVIRATAEDREPTANDLPIPSGEFNGG